MSEKNNIFEDIYEEKQNAPQPAEEEESERILVAPATGDAQAKLFKKVAWGSGLAGFIFGGILIYFFGKYM